MKFLFAMAVLGGLLYGTNFGAIAAASPYIKALEMFTDEQLGWIVGAVLFGGILASLSSGVLCDLLGRKKMIIASAAMSLVGTPVICMAGDSLLWMTVGRLLQGMSAGYLAVAMPLYLTETLPSDIRGRIMAIFQLCVGCGLVGAALVGLAVSFLLGAADAEGIAAETKYLAWKINFWWTLVPVALLFTGAFFLRESPVWMARRCGVHCATGKTPETNAASPLKSADSLLQRKYVVPFLMAMAVLMLSKTTGRSSITNYSVMIFKEAGFSGSLGNVGDLLLKIVGMISTVVAATLVDKKGRTWLLKVGTAGMTAGLLAISAVFFAIEKCGVSASPASGIVCLAAFFVVEVFFSLGPGIMVWFVPTELLPMRIRTNGLAIAFFTNQLAAWGLASTFLSWVNHWGWYSMFLFFTVNGALFFVVSCLLPETKGKSLAELEVLFDKKRHENR